ncbi:MAG: glycine dehydrogenase, partial [Bacteroidia bacterium]
MYSDKFSSRHIGPNRQETEAMLKTIGVDSLETLIDETVPANIRLKKPLNIAPALSEFEYLKHLKSLAGKNKIYRSYIGLGYYGTIVPAPIQRNILENPGWYTAYTPYQAEISQGRLEALLNFQTMVSDLTGLPIANASLLDEGTAAAEAMIMLYNSRNKDLVNNEANKFFVSDECFPQTIDILKTRSTPLGIELIIGDYRTFTSDGKVFGALLQYPGKDGNIEDYSAFTKAAHEQNILVAVAADILSLALLTPPGEWGADVVVGSSQRFGVPMGFGG